MKEWILRLSPHNWNDVMALFLIGFIFALWILDGLSLVALDLSPEVSGALIATWTLIVQYYFRRAPPANGGNA